MADPSKVSGVRGVRLLIVFFVGFLGIVGQAYGAGQTYETEKDAKEPRTHDAKTDKALGVGSHKGKTEAQKKAEEVETEYRTQKTLEDIRKKQIEDERKRIQHSVTEDRLTQQAESQGNQ